MRLYDSALSGGHSQHHDGTGDPHQPHSGPMFDPLPMRDTPAPPGMIVVRVGARTLDNDLLQRSVDECHGRWGIWGFSVLEVPDGEFEQLARVRPIVADRRQFMVADGQALIDDGFPLLPTLDWPHWTVVLAAATPLQFERVRGHFRGPLENPTYRARRG